MKKDSMAKIGLFSRWKSQSRTTALIVRKSHAALFFEYLLSLNLCHDFSMNSQKKTKIAYFFFHKYRMNIFIRIIVVVTWNFQQQKTQEMICIGCIFFLMEIYSRKMCTIFELNSPLNQSFFCVRMKTVNLVILYYMGIYVDYLIVNRWIMLLYMY